MNIEITKACTFLYRLKLGLVLGLTFCFAVTVSAQTYYPGDIGNTWVLESTTAKQRTTYTLEASGEGEQILLKIVTETLKTGELDTDRYFLTVDDEAIRVHSTFLEDPVALLSAHFPTPAIFFPVHLVAGDTWQIVADAEATLESGLTVAGESLIDFEVVGFEDIVTPAGTFQDCAKVELSAQLTIGGFLNLDSTTYQWLAPDIGPVQYQNIDGLIFKLISSNLLPKPSPYDVTGDGVVNILDLSFVASRFGKADTQADVTGDGIVNILDLVQIAQHFGD